MRAGPEADAAVLKGREARAVVVGYGALDGPGQGFGRAGGDFSEGLEIGVFAQQPFGASVLPKGDGAALHAQIGGDAETPQGFGVAVAHVTRDVRDEDGPVGANRVEIMPGEVPRLAHARVVVAVAEEPRLAGPGVGIGAESLGELRYRAVRRIAVKLAAALGVEGKVAVRVDEAGKQRAFF